MSRASVKTPEIEVEKISKENVYGGICLACKNSPMCTYPRNLARPVIQCEEFSGFEPALKTEDSRNVVLMNSFRAKIKNEERKVKNLQGLCVHCKNLSVCTLPKKEGGNWYCDEYQDED